MTIAAHIALKRNIKSEINVPMKNAISKTWRNKRTMEIGKIIKLTKTSQGLTKNVSVLMLNYILYLFFIVYYCNYIIQYHLL